MNRHDREPFRGKEADARIQTVAGVRRIVVEQAVVEPLHVAGESHAPP